MPSCLTLHGRPFRLSLTAQDIARRVTALASELHHLNDGNSLPLFIGILNGAVPFHSDLIRACSFNLEVAYLRTRSYRGLQSTGQVQIDWPAEFSYANRHVVVVEDIVDSGLTMSTLTAALTAGGAASLTTVVLLDKPTARVVEFSADHVGFTIPERFVVGYGLDYDGLGRNLPDIYELDE